MSCEKSPYVDDCGVKPVSLERFEALVPHANSVLTAEVPLELKYPERVAVVAVCVAPLVRTWGFFMLAVVTDSVAPLLGPSTELLASARK